MLPRPSSTLQVKGKKRHVLVDTQGLMLHGERVAEKPDLTGRELLGELNARGVDVSYYGVWNFLDHTGLSFKKKPARQRAGPR